MLASVICVWVTSAASGNSEGNRAEIAVILVNVHSQITNVSSSDLRKIFLGQITRWPNRHRINLLVRPDDSTEEKLLLSRLLRISDIDYAQHWVGQVFRGDAASPPRMIESVAGMKARLAEGEDAMGLLLQSQLSAKDAQSLRVLMIDNRLPDDPKYPLRK